MQIEFVRRVCLSFPHATEQVQWGADLVFKIGGKMFAVAPTELAPNLLSFKCDPETFAEMTERPGVIPAPYLARALWVSIQPGHNVTAAEVQRLLRASYDLVFAKLTKKEQAALSAAKPAKAPSKPRPQKSSRKPAKRRKGRG